MIGDQNDKVLLQHLRSADKDKPLKWIFDRINWDYQDPKGGLLTRKKVQNRLDYLRSLNRDKREEFLEICLENGLKIDWAAEGIDGQFSDDDDDDDDDYKEEEQAPPGPTSAPAPAPAPSPAPATKPPAPPTRTTKRDLATMTAENPSKRAKTVHYEVRVELGVPQETPVYEFQPGQIVYGEHLSILPAINELPGKDLLGRKTRNTGYVVSGLVQTTELFRDEEIELEAYVEQDRYFVIKSRDTQRFTKGLPDEKGHLIKIFENGQLQFHEKGMGYHYIVIDFGSIPLSASAITGIDSPDVEMSLVPYENVECEIKATHYPNPVEHWAIWEVARTDKPATSNEPLKIQKKMKKISKAAMLLKKGSSGKPKEAPASTSPPAAKRAKVPPAAVKSTKKIPPAAAKSTKKIPPAAAKSTKKIPPAPFPPLPPHLALPHGDDESSIEQIMNGDDNSVAKVLATCNVIEKELKQASAEHKQLVGADNEHGVAHLMEKCDQSHAKSRETLESAGFDRTHEDGGDGDQPMDSENAHRKRGRSLSPTRSKIMGAVHRIIGSPGGAQQ